MFFWLHPQKQSFIPNEYQIWCFNGIPRFVSAIYQPHGVNLKATYDEHWNRLLFVTSEPQYMPDIKKPESFEEMLNIAKLISENNPFLRVDFMQFGSKMYLGELTKYPAAGFVKWSPKEWNAILGGWLNLSNHSR